MEVTRFLGKPLSDKSLLDLAKGDNLDLIPVFVDKQLPEPEMMVTRSKAKQKEKERAYALTEALEDSIHISIYF